MPSLFVIQGRDQGTRFRLDDTTVTIGRGATNAVQLHDTEVSREHAQLYQRGDAIVVRDLGSSNGTFVNDERVHFPLGLKTGDLIRVGTLEFEVFITSLQPQVAASQGTASHVQAASDIAAPIGFGFKATIAEDDGPIDLGGRVPRVPPLRFDPLVRPQDIAPGGPAA